MTIKYALRNGWCGQFWRFFDGHPYRKRFEFPLITTVVDPKRVLTNSIDKSSIYWNWTLTDSTLAAIRQSVELDQRKTLFEAKESCSATTNWHQTNEWLDNTNIPLSYPPPIPISKPETSKLHFFCNLTWVFHQHIKIDSITTNYCWSIYQMS